MLYNTLIQYTIYYAILLGNVYDPQAQVLLCGQESFGEREGDIRKGGLCYAQGGSGYLLNNMAFKHISESPPCIQNGNNNRYPEDYYIGHILYEKSYTILTHCGSFSTVDLFLTTTVYNLVTLHRANSAFIDKYGKQLARDYHTVAGTGTGMGVDKLISRA